MTTIGITQLRNNLSKVLERSIRKPVGVNTKKGNVIIMSEQEYRNMQAMVELNANPKVKQSIVEGMKTPLSECKEIDIVKL
jgi:PHD/YefM family antitoxin component YafN of YafNO toxin-antitoxin module